MTLTVQMISASRLINLNGESDIKILEGNDNEVEASEAVAMNKPSIILLDYDLEKENTELFIKSLLIESPNSKVILLGINLSDEIVLGCLVSAIYGYMEWHDVDKFLPKAIRSVANGEAWVTRRLVGLLLERLRD